MNTVATPPIFEDLVTLLSQGLAQRSMYFTLHPRVQQSAKDFASKLAALLAAERREFLFLGFVEGNLVHEGRFLVGPTILGRRVVELLQALECGGILFKAGMTAAELLALFDLGADVRRRPLDLAGGRAALQQGAANIQLSPPYQDPGWFGQFLYEGNEGVVHVAGVDGLARMAPVYQRMFDSVQQSHELAGRSADLDLDGVRGVGEQLIAATDGSFPDVMQLVRYPDYDTFTVGHSVRVASIAVLVGHGAGMPRELLIEMATAGMLHDVGKCKIPDTILYKPGRLDDDERRVVERHPVLGAHILLENRGASQMAVAAAFGHHRRHDGGGYPGLPDWGVSSRITALIKVCDVFEALTAVRPYKSAMSVRSAYELMLKDQGSFDPGAFRALVAAVGLYPPGTRVLLSTGEHAVVASAGASIDQPLVRVTHDLDGAPLQTARLCDLAASAGAVCVVRTLTDRGDRAGATGAGVHTALCAHAQHDPQNEPIQQRIQKLPPHGGPSR